MDQAESLEQLVGRLDGLDMHNLPSNAAARYDGSALAVSPPYSDLSLDEKLRRIGRPLKPLPRKASNRGRSPISDRRPALEQDDYDAAPSTLQAPHARSSHGRQPSATIDGDAADLSGNSHASPATPTHIPSFYHSTFEKNASRTAEETLVDHLSEAVFRASLDNKDRSSDRAEAAAAAAAAATSDQLAVAAESDPSAFKFRDLPASVLSQGFYYRQRMAQIVLSCADEAKAAHSALMSRYYMKPFEQSGAPAAPALPETSGRVQNAPASTTSVDDCCGDESDGGDDSGDEFAWLENTGNKKKRKSARSSEVPEAVSTSTKFSVSGPATSPATASAGAVGPAAAFPAALPPASNPGAGATGMGVEQGLPPPATPRPPSLAGKGDGGARLERVPVPRELEYKAPYRLLLPRSRIPYSCRDKASQRDRLRAYFRRVRARRMRLREEEEAAREAEAHELAEEAERQARLAAEKKPQKRLTKAEKKAQARRGGAGAPKPMSIAAIKAARNDSGLAQQQQQQQQGGGQAAQSTEAPPKAGGPHFNASKAAEPELPAGPTLATAGPSARGKADSEDEVELLLGSEAADGLASNVEAPRGPFDFTIRSPIADSLEALRASMSAVSLQINNSLGPLGPLDGTFADVMDRAARDGSADLTPRPPPLDPIHGSPTSRLLPPPPSSLAITRGTTPSAATPTPVQRASSNAAAGKGAAAAARHVPTMPSHGSPSVKARPLTTTTTTDPMIAAATAAAAVSGANASAASTTAGHPSAAPPLHSPPPKLTRRKKATMNNVHHRANYVPTRMPSEGSRHNGSFGHGHGKGHGDREQPPGLDHPSTTCGLFDGEWMCVFCEYELLYGEPPLMFRACRNRKKIVANRKRAQARARRAAEGGSSAAVGGHHHHHHHHHHQHSEHAHDRYDEPKKKGGGSSSSGGSNGKAGGTHSISRTSQSHQRERCSCGNSIHESDEGSSAYTHSAPGSSPMERSKSGSHVYI